MKNRIIIKPDISQMNFIMKSMGNQLKILVFKKNKVIKTSIKRARLIKNIDAIYIPSYVEQLVEIMELLRDSQGGCPWDLEQNHKSLLKHLIEEAYEYCEAVELNDSALMLEELGDILLQVVFHCQIAMESGNFNLEDCAKGIKDKLIFRHPHIFLGDKAESHEAVEDIWKSQKEKEKHRSTSFSGLPPILRIEKTVDNLKSKYNLRKMDKNTYKRIVQLVDNEEVLINQLGELLLYVVVYGKIKGVNITFELQKSIRLWEKTLLTQ